MLEFRNLSKSFGSKKVLNQIDLSLAAGQTHVFLGRSGCGKSTLLRMVNGLVLPSEGEIFVDGTALTPEARKLLVSRMGYVIQEGGLFPHLTASDNIALVASVRGWHKAEIEKRLIDLQELMGFESQLLHRYPKELSGGQRQRIGLMRALMMNPDYLLLDEPLGALDPIVRANLQGELKSIFNRLQKTVLMVTHDIYEAAFFGHTVTLLRKGEVEQHGTFQELVRAPASDYVSQFIAAQKQPEILRELSP